MKTESMFTKILEIHTPIQKEEKEIKTKINLFLRNLENSVKLNNINAEVMLGGSAAKGTFLAEDFDVDVFVRFDYGCKDKDISGMLFKILKTIKLLKIIKVHGSRDYFQTRYDDIKYEIIPVLYVENPKDALNVTDMSPLHVKWIKNNITSTLRKEIILAKLFCKAQNLYGAESYINGFSGHVLDILIVNYGSFMNLLEASQKWKLYEVIDVEKYGTAGKLNRSKISPLIVIDPILSERNAAAALSREKFLLFKEKAKEFLAAPSENFFVKKEYSLGELKEITNEKKSKLLVLNVTAFTGKEDIIGSRLLKAYTHILKHLKINEFVVKNSGWKWDKAKKAMFWFVVDRKILSKEMTRIGPPLKAKKAADAFNAKHKKIFIKCGRLYAFVKRPFRKPEELVKHIINEEYVKEKVKTIKLKIVE